MANKTPLTVRAAWICLLCALVAIPLIWTTKMFPAGWQKAVGLVEAALIGGGFVLGMFSLLGIRRCGARRILPPALIGLSVEGLLLGAGVYAVFFLPKIDVVSQQLSGSWIANVPKPKPAVARLEMRPDHTYRFVLSETSNAASPGTTEFSGKWGVKRMASGSDLALVLNVQEKSPDSRVADTVVWRIDKVEPASVTFGRPGALQTYQREK